MATYVGKTAVLQLAALIGMIALLMGPILIYEVEDSGVKYSVYLESFNHSDEKIWGSIRVDIKNNNEFDITATHIKANIYNPDTNEEIYSLFYIGGTVKAGETFSKSLGFTVRVDSIPDTEIKVVLSAFVKWGSEQGNWVEHEFIIPIEY
jgi:hypothetical protein